MNHPFGAHAHVPLKEPLQAPLTDSERIDEVLDSTDPRFGENPIYGSSDDIDILIRFREAR